MKIKYVLNGRTISEKEFRDLPAREGAPQTNQAYSSHKPLESLAMSVFPHQAPDMREKLKGIQGAIVTRGGRVMFTSRRARREAMRRCGFVDRDGGFRD